MALSLVVARKEIREHLRDTRALVSTLVYALMGPMVVLLVSVSRSTAADSRSAVLLSMASVFALVSAFSGGMNVALDSLAGERERRSLVPLLATPASRLQLVIGKWLATTIVGSGSLAVTVVAFAGVFVTGASEPLGSLARGLTAWSVTCLLPVVLLGAALQVYVSAGSGGTKEAHTWLSVLVFIPMLAGMFLVFFPGSLGRFSVLVPLVGHEVLAAHVLDGGSLPVAAVAGLAGLTLAAAVPPLLATARRLDRDEVWSN